MNGLQNANPSIYESVGERIITEEEKNEEVYDSFDAREIFDIFLLVYIYVLFIFVCI